MQSRTIIVYPILGIPWRSFQNFCLKKFGPAGKLPCGTLIRRKKKRTGNHIHLTAEKFGENCPADIRRRFPKFLPYITRRHLLLNGSSGIVWACLALVPGGHLCPSGTMICKTAAVRCVPARPEPQPNCPTAACFAPGKGFSLSPEENRPGCLFSLHNSLTKAVSRMHKTKKELQKALQTVHLYRPAPESRGSRLTGRSLSVNTPVPSG